MSPFEVEEALVSHPAVANLIAFAADHALHGEAVGVGVVLRPAAAPFSLHELR